jgi:hypothetical protein
MAFLKRSSDISISLDYSRHDVTKNCAHEGQQKNVAHGFDHSSIHRPITGALLATHAFAFSSSLAINAMPRTIKTQRGAKNAPSKRENPVQAVISVACFFSQFFMFSPFCAEAISSLAAPEHQGLLARKRF